MADPAPGNPVIGILGGVGAGKSTVAAALAELGCAVVDADAIGHALLDEPDVRRELRRRWGDCIFALDGAVDRRALARVVFDDPAQLEALDRIMHPPIRRRMADRIAELSADPSCRAVAVDAAVLLEAGWDDLCTHLVFVRAPASARARRAAEKGLDRRAWRKREKSQFSLDRKAEKCDYAIDNSSAVSHLHGQAREILHRIIGTAGQPS